MPAQREKYILPLAALGFTAGTWTPTLTSNVLTARKTAADNAPTVVFTFTPPAETPLRWEQQVEAVELPYKVATAALDAAPTITVRKVTLNETSGVVSVATVSATTAIRGLNTTGTAAGDYVIKSTFATPTRLEDNEYLQVEVAFDAAGTTVLDVFPARITLA